MEDDRLSSLGEGDSDFDWFGHSLAVHRDLDGNVLVAIGSPSSAECGTQCLKSPGKVTLANVEGQEKKIERLFPWSAHKQHTSR